MPYARGASARPIEPLQSLGEAMLFPAEQGFEVEEPRLGERQRVSVRNRLGSGAKTLLVDHPAERRLCVNTFGRRFEGVEPEVMRYEIDGYAVLPGWLRARACRVLSAEAAATFCRIAAALALTLEVQARIAAVGWREAS